MVKGKAMELLQVKIERRKFLIMTQVLVVQKFKLLCHHYQDKLLKNWLKTRILH